MLKTIKLYNTDAFLASCKSKVVDIKDNKIVLDRTVAFAEGGGQISDSGWIVNNATSIPFLDVQKGVGRMLYLDNFPCIHVDTPIYHTIPDDYVPYFSIGQDVIVQIDINKRIKTTVLHSALHMVLMEAVKYRDNLMNLIKGCYISDVSARIDFILNDRFSIDEINKIKASLEVITKSDIPVYTYSHPDEAEALYWKCLDFSCPCGGTHVTNTNQIGKINIMRKNIGKNSERLIVEVSDINLPSDLYKNEV